jgi:hypothetical protein
MEIAQAMLSARTRRAAIAQAEFVTDIQIGRLRCRLIEMRIQPHIQRRATRAINVLVIVGGLYFWWSCLPPPPDPWILNLTNNPDKFFLWGAATNFNHSFTYDPHAADEWRFEHGVFPAWPPSRTNDAK